MVARSTGRHLVLPGWRGRPLGSESKSAALNKKESTAEPEERQTFRYSLGHMVRGHLRQPNASERENT
jgi:hypothetical protein